MLGLLRSYPLEDNETPIERLIPDGSADGNGNACDKEFGARDHHRSNRPYDDPRLGSTEPRCRGYPNGLKGDAILLEPRIMAVADVVESMTSHRPYRPALGVDVALAEIEQGSGKIYDPVVADACLKLFRANNYKFD
jgi:hypothetical protein